ncbi:MAG: TIR domain-containing protein [Pseudomonadota bacterium]
METGQPANEKLKVFVSYSRADVADADQIVALLDKECFQPIIDRHSIEKGAEWEPRLGALLFECDKVVFVLTENSAASPVCQWEVDEAARLGKPMVPVTLRDLPEGTEPPQKLKDRNYIFLYSKADVPGSGWFTGSQDLVEWLRSDLAWTRQRTRLMERAQQYTANPVEAQLMRGEVLQAALAFAAGAPKGETIPQAVSDYITASEAAEARLKAEAEADLAEREAAVQRAQEAVETEQAALKKAERAQRGARRATWLGLVAAVALTIIGGLATWYATDRALDAQTLRSQLFAGEAVTQFEAGEDVHAFLLALIGEPAAQQGLIEPYFRESNSTSQTVLEHAMTHSKLDAEFVSERPILAVAVHPSDPRLILTSHEDTTAKLWRIGEDAPLQIFEGHGDRVHSVAFHPDGERILTGSWDDTARLWRIGEDAPLQTFEGHVGSVYSVAFHPDGAHILTGSGDSTAKLWRIGEDAPLQTFEEHEGSVNAVAIHPDGARILTGAGDDTAKLWRIGEDAPLQTFNGHAGAVTSVAFHHDGERILTGSWDDTAKLWRIGEDAPIQTFGGHEGMVDAVAFHPDGNRILTGSWDATAKLWRIGEDAPLQTFEGHERPVLSVAIHPDGERLLMGSINTSAKLWALHDFLLLSPDEQVVEACAMLDRMTNRPWLTDEDRQAIPVLRGLSDAELDPCDLRPPP